MSRYFSKLSKRTGIDVNNAGRLRRQTAQVDIQPVLQATKTASIKRGLEVNVEKISDAEVSQHNFEIGSSLSEVSKISLQNPVGNNALTSPKNVPPEEFDFSLKGETPSQSLKSDSVKKNIDDGSAELRSNMPEMAVPQSGVFEGEEQQLGNMSKNENPPHETSDKSSTVKKNGSDYVLLIDKHQYTADPGNRVPDHIPLESENRETGESRDDSSLDPIPSMGTREMAGTLSAMIESSEKMLLHREPRAIHIVSEKGRTAETKLNEAETAAHNNSVDIHIGTISFEVHQSPEKKAVIDNPPPVQKPVVIQQAHSPKTPRLSRYYLRGM